METGTQSNPSNSSATRNGAPPRKARMRGGEMRERFIEAALDLIRNEGIAVSTRSICDAVGVKAPTLYHHFGDMRSLLNVIVERAFENYRDRLSHGSDATDPFQKVRNAWDSFISFSIDEPALFSILELQNSSADLPAAILTAHEEIVATYREIGKLRPLRYPPDVAAQMHTAGCLGTASVLAAQKRGLADIPQLGAIMREAVLSSILL
jgi:AcrR family transcriptional regulator